MAPAVAGQPPTVVVLGASEYDNRPDLDNACFARSKHDLLDVVTGIGGIERDRDVLDYFDHPELRTWAPIASDLGKQLDALERDRATDRSNWPLIVVYIGHGEQGDGGVRLGLAGSDKNFSTGTAVTGEMLGTLLNERARGRPHFYLVDACYAGLLGTGLQSDQSWNGGGVVLLAAAHDEVAVAAPSALHSVFTGLVIDHLHHGDGASGPVTIRSIHEAVYRNRVRAPGRSAPAPYLEVVSRPDGQPQRTDLLDMALLPDPSELLAPVVIGSSWEDERGFDRRKLRTAVDLIASTDQVRQLRDSGGKRVTAPYEVFGSREVAGDPYSFKRSVAALAGADLAFVDLTDHEPSVMVLLGVRAAVTRGVTICSAQEGEYDRVLRAEPFHLHEVPLAKHGYAVPRQAASELAKRAAAGLRELHALPHSYQDLPVFDALRNTHGPGETRLQRSWDEYALVLCPFAEDYTNSNWEAIRVNVPKAINAQLAEQERPASAPTIARTLDLDSPRTVSHALFEALRRTQLCIIDLTHWRPGVLFELGVRLAVNRVPPICLIEGSQLSDLRDLEDDPDPARDREWDVTWNGRGSGLSSTMARRIRTQALGLVDLLQPIEYDPYSDDLQDKIADHLSRIVDPFSTGDRDGRHLVVDDDLRWLIWRHAHAEHDAHASAEAALLDPVLRDGGRDVDAGQRYLVYPASSPIWRTIRDATAERQFMAWLYLHARDAHGGLDEELSALRVELDKTLQSLVNSGQASEWIATAISQAGPDPSSEAAPVAASRSADPLAVAQSRRAEARFHQANGRYEAAEKLFASAAADLHAHLDELPVEPGESEVSRRGSEIANALTQLWGGAGGNARRLDRWNDALRYYERGYAVERDKRWGMIDSYMLTNFYTAKLAVDPNCYEEIRPKLREAARDVRQQVSGPRSDQWWAWADAAQLSILAGEFEKGRIGFREYLERGDPGSFTTSGDVLELLSGRLREAGKFDVADELAGWASRLLDPQLGA